VTRWGEATAPRESQATDRCQAPKTKTYVHELQAHSPVGIRAHGRAWSQTPAPRHSFLPLQPSYTQRNAGAPTPVKNTSALPTNDAGTPNASRVFPASSGSGKLSSTSPADSPAVMFVHSPAT
jgi:hypothetical protein